MNRLNLLVGPSPSIIKRIRWWLGLSIIVEPMPSLILDNLGMVIKEDGSSSEIPMIQHPTVRVRPYKLWWQWWVKESD